MTAGVLRSDANAGKVALVTGGGTGIGRGAARALARSGARVAICGRRDGPLEEVRAGLEREGAECVAVRCDIREPDQVESMVAAVLERYGSIDVLVANAGGQFGAPAAEIGGKGWRAVERLNLDGNWELTRRIATEAMIPARRGLIVFVGFSPRRGIPGFAHACATRAALENLASSLALEWSRYGIRSVCLSCGPIETEGLASYGPDSLEESRRTVPLGRLGSEDEVGQTVAFVASPGGAFITGTTILVDGGVDAWGLAEPPPPPG
ncbi:MAG: short-chain dehydrogenase [Actinomycetes bacterium]|nr:MAG: short-chain dehydrogenase [Actinomycetes bacterium]